MNLCDECLPLKSSKDNFFNLQFHSKLKLGRSQIDVSLSRLQSDLDKFRENRVDVSLSRLQSDLMSLETHLILLKQQRKLGLEASADHEIRKLEEQAARINFLSRWLETELLEFSQTDNRLNQIHEEIQQLTEAEDEVFPSRKYQNSCVLESQYSMVPIIVKKQSNFILKSRKIDFLWR